MVQRSQYAAHGTSSLIEEPPMIALIQRVGRCSVIVDGASVASIGQGLLILLGVHADDTDEDLKILARKCLGLRIFSDEQGKMNLSVGDIKGAIVVVSQFTLFGDVRRGLRPYFGEAALPEKAERMYNQFITALAESGLDIQVGVFGTHMDVELVNDGPVTISINTKELLNSKGTECTT